MRARTDRLSPAIKASMDDPFGPDRRMLEAERLLDSVSRILGVGVCLHDRLALAAKLPRRLKFHLHPACIHMKRVLEGACVDYDVLDTHGTLASTPEGRVNRCPAGFIEVAVPVSAGGLFAGVLFAGPMLQGAPPPGLSRKSLPPSVPSERWLEDCRRLLLSVAARLGPLLHDPGSQQSADRRQAIISFVSANHLSGVSLSSLAAELHLSESRTGHLVKALFRMSFPELLNSFRLRNAAGLLLSTDLPISEVASKAGFRDQNYFARRFKILFGTPPSSFRAKKSLLP